MDEDEVKVSKVQLPLTLKQIMLLDTVAVEEGKIYSLPCTPTVIEILNQFTSQSNLHPSSFKVVQDLGYLFDRTLGLCLLYHEERPQYRELLQATRGKIEDVRLASIYGAVHLLRLLVKLPLLMAQASLPEDSMVSVKETLITLYSFLDKNKGLLFCEVFEAASPGTV